LGGLLDSINIGLFCAKVLMEMHRVKKITNNFVNSDILQNL
jgi:hypothetical protein